MQELSGRRFGNYRLQHLLGQGGFADVYLGEHIYLHTQVAIKVLHIRVAVESLDHFLHEAQVVAQLDHPHIVRVFEFDVVEGIPYLVMTYAPFGSMRQRFVRSVSQDPAQVLPYVQQVASALQYAHDRKLIHRDVKPENILLGRHEEVLLSDFGLVLLAQSSSSMRTEEMAGTISYMAPEQIQGRPRLASDQYALGIIVYEWLCGERPFNGNFVEIASQHTLAPPPSLCQRVPGLAPAIEAVVFKALAKVPEERYPNVLAFADALTSAVQHAEKVLSPNLLTSNVTDRPVSTPLPPSPRTNEAEQTNDRTVLREPQQTLLPPTQEALSRQRRKPSAPLLACEGNRSIRLLPHEGHSLCLLKKK